MNIQEFLKQSGLKVLAVSGLTDCELSIMLYLLNCSVSGIDEVLTNENELAMMLRQNIKFIQEGLAHLHENEFIRLQYGDISKKPKIQSMRITLQLDVTKWKVQLDDDESSHAAVIYPFKRGGQFTLVDGMKGKNFKPSVPQETWQRIYEAFSKDRHTTKEECRANEMASVILADTMPVDQVILLIRHFGERIPSLSLLASSWHHFNELYEQEDQKVDFGEARVKHHELDQKIRDAALEQLTKRKEMSLTDDEVCVLEVLGSHRHPRRQLFWAFQLRTRYPNLSAFFLDTQPLMLPVTTGGNIVKF